MTIKDLSAQTGYSVGTISRVLNDQPNVSEKAKRIILQAARESGFQLNVNAKQLKQRQTNSILVVARGRTNELFSRLIEIILARTAELPFSLVVDYVDETGDEVQRAIQLCREKKPMGIIFLGGNREHFLAGFEAITQPCVLVTSSAEGLPFPNLSSVCSDDTAAARTAMEALISLGHRHFAIIGSYLALSDTARLRYQGCLEALEAHGIPFQEKLDYETALFSYEEGYRAACRLLQRGRKFTALFAMSEVMAIGAIRALQDAGLRVPEDVAVMGLDGLTIGEYTVPRLATVAQSTEALAERSLALLRASIEHHAPARHEKVPVTLQCRESAGKILPE